MRTLSGMVRNLAVVVALVVTGCATSSRPLKPMAVAVYAGPILRDGSAVVPSEAGDVRVNADDVIDVHLVDVDGVERPFKLTVRQLVAGCATDVTSPACAAGRAVDEPVLTKKKVRFDSDRAIQMVAIAGVGAGLGWCTVACEDPDREFKRGGMIAGGVAVGAIALFSLFLLGGL